MKLLVHQHPNPAPFIPRVQQSWKRCCERQWGLEHLHLHSSSWKQCPRGVRAEVKPQEGSFTLFKYKECYMKPAKGRLGWNRVVCVLGSRAGKLLAAAGGGAEGLHWF